MDIEHCMKALRTHIYDESAKRDMNMEELSRYCKISYTTIWKIINTSHSKNDVKLSTLLAISNALGLPISYLIGESEVLDESR